MKNVILFTVLFVCKAFGQSTDVFDAARSGDLQTIKTFIKKGGNIDTLNADGNSLLLLSIYRDQNKVADWLLKHNTNIHLKTAQGNALLAAVYKGNITMTSRLLKAGAEVNTNGPDGNSALQYAVLSGNEKLVQLCLDYHANRLHRNNDEKTALDLAEALKNTAIINSLKP